MNKCILMGRLTADPELKSTPSGVSVTSFNIAVDRERAKDAERKADFPTIVAWRSTAEFVCKHFRKGKPIIVEGRIQTRTYDDNGKTRYITEVVAGAVKFVLSDNSARTAAGSGSSAQDSDASNNSEDWQEVEDDDLPF